MTDEVLEVLEGVAEELVFRREDTGFTVLDISTEDGELITVVGVLPEISAGEELRLSATGTPTRRSAASSVRSCVNAACQGPSRRC